MSKLFLALFLALTPTAFGSIWYVDGVNGNDNNDCKTRQTACKTIGHAISLASSGDTIGVGPATYTENLTISVSLNLIGSGASTTIIDGGGIGTVVTITAPEAKVTLANLTIQNGNATMSSSDAICGGGVFNTGTLTISKAVIARNTADSSVGNGACGGAVFNSGTLTIISCTLADNQALGKVGLHEPHPRGGGIFNDGVLTLNDSTLISNRAHGFIGWGGGIFNDRTATMNNSTASENEGVGGGIYNGSGTFTISSSTISDNLGGDVYNASGSAVFQNSIVASDAFGDPNCFQSTSNGYNLSSDNTCTFNGPGDLNNTNPKLGPLLNNGGPTLTQALLPGSPAIDAGNPNGCTDGTGHLLKTDQRGAPRHDKEDTSGCDIGAYEKQSD